ncbi:MAG TPA: pantetheine-phosphate adenylyltransferase [Armatimonadetes bacterium]|jgi:pantetheine-phosphate adenylyltransferase|nr:pantetheine-phosphate adenylyltransferase [Armatimonadota bacterium]
MEKRIAVCPGSFDPITLGHVDIIRRAANLFDQVIVAVAQDARKSHMLSIDERVELAEAACAGIVNVIVEPFEGLLVEYCVRRRAVAIVKGIRNLSDIPDEAQMQAVNADLAPGVETLFLIASPQWAHISSSMVRWLNELDADVSRYVPEAVAHWLRGNG